MKDVRALITLMGTGARGLPVGEFCIFLKFFFSGPRGSPHLFYKSTVLYTCTLYIQLHKNNINMICKLFAFRLVKWGLLKYSKGNGGILIRHTYFNLYKQISVRYCKNFLFYAKKIQFCCFILFFFWGEEIFLKNRGKIYTFLEGEWDLILAPKIMK